MKLIYNAYDTKGQTICDAIEAGSEAEAMAQLRRDGLFVMELRQAGDADEQAGVGSTAHGPGLFGRSKRLRNLSMFARQLYVLCSTGTPLVEAMTALERQTRDEYFRGVIHSLRSQVEEGNSLADAMQRHPHYFDPVFRSLVAAGESGGNFESMLDRLAVLVQRQDQTRKTVQGALVYPILLLSVSVIVLALLMTLVLPRFAGMFETLDMPLPASTEVLLILGEGLASYWWALLLAIAAAAGGMYWWLKTPQGQYMCDTVVIRLPSVGGIARGFITARIVRLLGTLLESQVPLLEALQLTRESAGNEHYRRLIDRADEAATRGDPISVAFRDSWLISPAVYEALKSGESTGQIGPLLLNVAEFLDEDNESILRSLTSILEPIILIGLGLLVGAVALSLFLPLFDLTASVGS